MLRVQRFRLVKLAVHHKRGGGQAVGDGHMIELRLFGNVQARE